MNFSKINFGGSKAVKLEQYVIKTVIGVFTTDKLSHGGHLTSILVRNNGKRNLSEFFENFTLLPWLQVKINKRACI